MANKKVRGRPATGVGFPIQIRLQPHDLDALDAFVAISGGATRSGAVRAILADWLASHGFTKREGHDHPEPFGPATDAIRAMDAAIGENKKKRAAARRKIGPGEESPQPA